MGFIIGSVKQPEDEDSIDRQKWITYYYLVSSWITNLMKVEYVEAFIHAPTTTHLWKDINGIYGQNCGTVVYQLEREVLQIIIALLSMSILIRSKKFGMNFIP